jgi:hypothetical protein
MDLRDHPDGRAGLGRGEGGALAGEAGSYDEDVVVGHCLVTVLTRSAIGLRSFTGIGLRASTKARRASYSTSVAP